MARALCYKPRGSIGSYPDGPIIDSEQYRAKLCDAAIGHLSYKPFTSKYISKVNYDLWLGPAPKRAFNPNRFHYDWHYWWDYALGDIGGQGPQK